MKTKRFIFTLFLSISILFNSVVPCFASTVEPWTNKQKTSYLVNHVRDLLPEFIGIVFGGSANDHFTQTLRDIWNRKAVQDNLSYDDWVSQYVSYDFGNNPNEPTRITIEPTLLNDIQVAVNDTVTEYSQNYSLVRIPGTNDIPGSFFDNSTIYNNFVNAIKPYQNHIILVSLSAGGNPLYYYNSSGAISSFNPVIQGYIFKSLEDIAFYKGANTNTVDVAYKWTRLKSSLNSTTEPSIFHLLNSNSNNIQVDYSSRSYIKTNNTPVGYYLPNVYFSYSLKSTLDTTFYIMNVGKSTTIKVYKDLDSVKDSNSLYQPFYYTNNFNSNATYSTSKSISSTTLNNSSNVYDNIVNNITSSNDQTTINNIFNQTINNGGSGSGGGNVDNPSDDKESLWDKIKDSVGDFFKSIAEVIEGLVGLVVDTVVKTLTSLVNGFNSILTTMKDFFLGGEETEGFFDIMSGFFDWLPEPLPLMLKSIFTLACVFALIKMIKGLAS